jgi:hypothetical protein
LTSTSTTVCIDSTSQALPLLLMRPAAAAMQVTWLLLLQDRLQDRLQEGTEARVCCR